MLSWALAALCCGLATTCDLSTLANHPLSRHMVTEYCTLSYLSLCYVLGMPAQTVRTCLENQQGPTLNWKCVPSGATKRAFIIFHNLPKHRQTRRSICLQHKKLTDTHGETEIFYAKRNTQCNPQLHLLQKN